MIRRFKTTNYVLIIFCASNEFLTLLSRFEYILHTTLLFFVSVLSDFVYANEVCFMCTKSLYSGLLLIDLLLAVHTDYVHRKKE